MGELNMPPFKLEKCFQAPSIYIHIRSVGCRLKLCSAAYENTPKCNISMEKDQNFCGRCRRDVPLPCLVSRTSLLHTPLDAFDVSSSRNEIMHARLINHSRLQAVKCSEVSGNRSINFKKIRITQ